MRKTVMVIKSIMFGTAVIILILASAGAVMKIKPVIVISGSMEPAIGTGSLAFINQRDTDIEAGDVIAFSNNSMMIAHRVVEITEEGYLTKGDNNENRDLGAVLPDQVEGTVFFSIPRLGMYLSSLTSLAGIISAVTVCVSLLLLGVLIRKDEVSDENEG
jgi:signal peptidase